MIAIWDTRFSVGNALADAEHRQVISILNEIEIARLVGAPSEVVEKALESLVGTINTHFSRDQAPRGEHAAIAAAARRVLDSWRNHVPGALDRRVLVNLARRWIDHMGRHESFTPPQRLAG